LREPGDCKWVIGGVLYVGVNLLYRLRTYYIDGIFSSNDYYRGLNFSRYKCSLGGGSPEYVWN